MAQPKEFFETVELETDEGRSLRTGDPAVLRALAHPLRV